MRGTFKAATLLMYDPLTPLIPAGAHHNMVRPFGGGKVH
jgi:hypothetical protein